MTAIGGEHRTSPSQPIAIGMFILVVSPVRLAPAQGGYAHATTWGFNRNVGRKSRVGECLANDCNRSGRRESAAGSPDLAHSLSQQQPDIRFQRPPLCDGRYGDKAISRALPHRFLE